MATQTKTVEVIGISGQTTAFATERDGNATGTALSVTVIESAGTGIYTVSVNWNDSSASNEPLGNWSISIGDASGSLGRSLVTFTTAEDNYTLGASNAPSSQEIAEELEREDGPLYLLYRMFDGIDKIIKWLRK